MTLRRIDYTYDECGLENVVLKDFAIQVDDAGDEVITIPNVNGLHRVLVHAVAIKPGGLAPSEIRFLRSEMRLSQAELAKLIGKDGQTVGRWERGETPIDQASQMVVRRKAIEYADIDDVAIDALAECSTYSAVQDPIRIQADDPDNYRPVAA